MVAVVVVGELMRAESSKGRIEAANTARCSQRMKRLSDSVLYKYNSLVAIPGFEPGFLP